VQSVGRIALFNDGATGYFRGIELELSLNDHAVATNSSSLADSLNSGRFVITAELSPPISTDPAALIARARTLKGLAAAVNVTDGANAKAHMAALVAAHFLLQSGIEPILQMTCRDRNRIALQGDLIGALALGVRNVLVLTGDDPKAGDQPDTKPVFDVDSVGFIKMAHQLRSERALPTGTAVHGPIDLTLGAADVPVDPPPDWQPRSLIAKAAAGADFIQTQFCMDIGIVRRYAARLVELGVAPRLRILIGVAPLSSAGSARWMREKLFGTIIPDSIVERLERAADPKAEGKAICVQLLQQLAQIPGIAGAHIMAPRNHDAIAEVISAAGLPSA
jgi:methylenetetrahydrofolate reductase (NADPH)